jgi:hypothetical protein
VPCLAGAQGRSQPLTEDFIEAIAIMPFFRTYPMDLLLFSHLMKQYNRFAIHLLSKDRSFLARMIVIPYGTISKNLKKGIFKNKTIG